MASLYLFYEAYKGFPYVIIIDFNYLSLPHTLGHLIFTVNSTMTGISTTTVPVNSQSTDLT